MPNDPTLTAVGLPDLSGGLPADLLRTTPNMADPTFDNHPRLLVGDHIGRFEVRQQIGEGAFGAVYRAFDPVLRRDVAVKVPKFEPSGRAAAKDRFLREARAAATVRHSNVCPVFEVGEQEGSPFIVMAYVPGRSLDQELARQPGPMPPDEAARVVRAMAKGAHAAHSKGVLHRDLKPGNVLFDSETQGFVITDFGLARAAEPGDPLGSGLVVQGTPAYMSPEQVRGDAAAIGPRSDVYALGVILFELLTRRLPYPGPSVADVIAGIITAPVPSPSKFVRDIPPALDAICRQAMAKNPLDRFPTARALADVLTPYAAPESGRRRVVIVESDPEIVIKPNSSRRRWLAALAALVIAASGLGAYVVTRDRGAPADSGESTTAN